MQVVISLWMSFLSNAVLLQSAPRSAAKSQSILIKESGRVYRSTWNSPTVDEMG